MANLGILAFWLGLVVEGFALALVPLVLLRRKEPSSTAAWILALVFLPGIGATLFLMFGRDRLRLPAQWKREADRELAARRRDRALAAKAAGQAGTSEPPPHPLSTTARERALQLIPEAVDLELFRVGSALSGAAPTPGNAVELLVDGEATYAAIGAAIDAATRTVFAEYYLIRPDATADWFKARLVAAAGRGVEVKLLVDGYGSFWLKRRWVRELRAAGVDVVFFLPARLLLFQPMNLRNHRKIVVVDGVVAFTGGINVGDEYRGRAGPWRDTHLEVRGPAARQLSDIFAHDWHFATRHEIPRERLGPADGTIEPAGDATMAIVQSGPDLEGPAREAIHRLFFGAITRAASRVWITTPYFIPDRSILVALQTAALRGVDVRLLFPSKSNHKVVFQAGRSFYEDLLAAGVSIWEYGPGMIHAKTMVVDGVVAMVGSANMDLRSFRLNFEVHTVVHDDALSAALERCFEADLAVSNRIEREAFRARRWWWRVGEGAARLLIPLM